MARTRDRGSYPSVRFALGAALAPFSLSLAWSAASALVLVSGGAGAAFFSGGLVGYALLYFSGLARWRPAYVFAHELTHAASAWMLGGRVLGFSAGSRSGSVRLSRSNAFIALSPYWVPLYAMAAVLAFRALSWAWPHPHARQAFQAVLGACLAFHALHTAESLLAARQGDLDETGAALGLSLIVLANGALMLVLLKCLFPSSVDLGRSWGLAWSLAGSFYRRLAGAIFSLAAMVR